MVTPHGEPWEVVPTAGSSNELNVYDCNGEFKFMVEKQYSNITQEELERMVFCFNACLGIPDGALGADSIWRQGYDSGYKSASLDEGRGYPDTEHDPVLQESKDATTREG